MRGSARITALLWLALLAAAGLIVHHSLRISGDLRLFMPAAHDAVGRLLLEEVSEGPAAKLLLVAINGAPPEALAATSQKLSAALRSDPAFGFVSNGEQRLDMVPDALLPYRYLLSPTLDTQPLDTDYLRDQLQQREQDLASPAATLLTPLLPRDPTLELLKVLEAWEPAQQAQQLFDVWFNKQGDAALMIVQTRVAGFDPNGQKFAIEALRRHFNDVRTQPAMQLIVSGSGAFAVTMQARSEADARLAAILDSVGMVLLMLLAYGSFRRVLLGALPLATAGLCGLGAAAALFSSVHGITIAFGFTLTGVALDYPIYLFSNEQPGVPALQVARSIWPTLATAVAAVCIAYLAFLVSGVLGLAQLATFNIVGLAAAGLCTRYLLPRLLPTGTHDYGASWIAGTLEKLSGRLPLMPWLAPAIAVLALVPLLGVRGPWWDTDLGHLTPVPEAMLSEYESLQQALGAPDVRYLLALQAPSPDALLTREETLSSSLAALTAQHAIGGFDLASRYLPSAAVQRRRQAALPDAPTLKDSLDHALAGMAFRPGLFAPFLADVARARSLPPLTEATIAGTPLALTVGSLLQARDGGWTGLVTLTDVRAPQRLAALAAASGGTLQLLDLKQAAEDLVSYQRQRILASVAAAAVLLLLVVAATCRSFRRMLRVVTPMALSTLVTLALLHGAGVALNLFHLIALVLAAGLGLDYGLFLERASHESAAHRRALHTVTICATAACVVFAVLGSSALPVLRSIGITVVLGVASNFVLAQLLIRRTGDR
ncbi:MAG TPA: MMPL family transporter [Steroidobacteraceae bacterium]|nr:MMPL family transporter [Steroidobacteraceae bacterium]